MRIKFKRKTLGTVMCAEQLYTTILDSLPESLRGKFEGSVSLAALLIANTIPGSVELTPEEVQISEFEAFRAAIDDLDAEQPLEAFEMYKAVDDEIVGLWHTAYQQAHRPLVPKIQQDGRLLSDEEKQALADPEDPLLSPG